jgi:poly(3-hydroxybutyrate) depolymerase
MYTDLLSLFQQNFLFLSSLPDIDFPPPPQWATPHRVILELDTLRLLDFGGDGPKVLVNAPYAGHPSSIADYDDGQSLVQVLLAAGHHVYCTDWKSATYEMKDYGIERYLLDLGRAIRTIGNPINLVGLCQGGWLAAMYACLNPVESLVLAGAPLNTQAGDGILKQMTEDYPLSYFRWLVDCGGGLLRGQYMLAGWKSMHPEQHYWKKYLELFEHVDDAQYMSRAKTFASWYEHTLDLPGTFYLEAVDQLFQKNLFFKGEMRLLGERLDLSSIDCPVFLLAGAKDDITPPEQVLSAASLFRNVQTAVAPGGHVGLFMGRDTLRQHWTKIADWITAQDRTQQDLDVPLELVASCKNWESPSLRG